MRARRIAIEEDDRLADEFAARDRAAFDRAYAQFSPLLEAVAARVLGSSGDARDCVHDALVRVWDAGTYRRERGALRAFLVVCVRNEALTRVRAEARHRTIESATARDVAVIGLPETDRPDPIDVARLRRAIEGLPPAQRAALSLAYYASLSQTEIADRLHVPLGTVKSRLAAAVRALADAVLPPSTDI